MLPSGRDRTNRYHAPPGAQFGIDLKLFTSVLAGKNFVKSLTQEALNWRRTIRLNGGYWQGTFRIVAPMGTLVDYFYNWLGWHFEESVQGVTSWEGMIYEMVLNTPNASRVKSLDKLYNHCRVKYVDSGGADQITAAADLDASLARYGQREAIEDVGEFDATAAAARRDTYLKEYGWPWARPQASGMGEEASLDVTVCGYVFTANWRHTTQADDATDTVHDFISDILTNDCAEFLTVGTLGANTTSVERSVDDYTRAWELIQKLVKVGDASGNIYRAYVRSDRKFYYEQLNKTGPENYIVKGMIAGRLDASEALNPWFVQPGVFRDMDTPLSYTEEGSYLNNARDMIVEEVSCGMNSGLTWQALDYSESAQLAAFQEYAKESAMSGGGAVQRTITDAMLKRMGVSRGKWAKLTPAQRRKLKKKL